jgi:hypothetical protein
VAKKVKNQDLLHWALTGAKERLNALRAEIERIYQTFPSLRGTRQSSAEATPARAASGGRKRRRFSPAARAKLRAAAKRRWAEAKKAGKKRLG